MTAFSIDPEFLAWTRQHPELCQQMIVYARRFYRVTRKAYRTDWRRRCGHDISALQRWISQNPDKVADYMRYAFREYLRQAQVKSRAKRQRTLAMARIRDAASQTPEIRAVL